jgi:shikimate kinase
MLIVLLGHRAVGKTTLGQLLAQRLALPFWDSDRELARAYDAADVRQLAQRLGQEGFRQAEACWLENFLDQQGRQIAPGMLALGAGAIETRQVRALLGDIQSIALWCAPERMRERLAQRGAPVWAVAQSTDAAQLASNWALRTAWFRELAQHHLALSGEQERDLARLEAAAQAIWTKTRR